jgi:hypothetical protein
LRGASFAVHADGLDHRHDSGADGLRKSLPGVNDRTQVIGQRSPDW